MYRFTVLCALTTMLGCGSEPAAPAPAPEPAAPPPPAAEAEPAAPAAPAEEAPAAAAAVGAATPDAEGVVRITGNDMMQFSHKRIEVKAGGQIKLELKHVGKMPKTAMGHNFVLLKADADLTAFATKAATAADTDYIPADLAGQVIVSTKTLGGGESETIEFAAPAAGTYKFLCSFPGHFAMMQGDFVVE